MRLAFPRVNSLLADDGTASISFVKVNMDRDTGGLDYLFEFKAPSGKIDVRTTVAIDTGFAAANKLAESGTNLWSLETTEVRQYIERYADEYGHIFRVCIFEVPANTSDSGMLVLRDVFCKLFLEYWSSYTYSNAAETCDPAGCYPDNIQFVPYDVDEKFRMTLHAMQRGRN